MMERVVSSPLKKILCDFPRNIKFCFAYGSGVMKQKTDPSRNMLDLIFVVHNSKQWHAENLGRNPHHYVQPLRFLGSNAVKKLQETWAAQIYYNTLIKSSEGRLIKYGVISEISLVADLLDWNFLYLAGRLHKPVEILVEPDETSQLRAALVQNLHSAVHAALLLLPENFTEIDFFRIIAGLSYQGDFRMIFGEDKSKIDNIVVPQIQNFRELYAPVLKHFDNYIEIPQGVDASTTCNQDTSPTARIHHLNQLPRIPQMQLVRIWSNGPRSKDTEDCLRAIAHDPDCSSILLQVLQNIVWRSSVSQSIKGICTAGLVKSIKYSAAKIMKMLNSGSLEKAQLTIPTQDTTKVGQIVHSAVNKEEAHIKPGRK
ncbi:phosphatidate cytidylyltransferase, mitochondrial isoform X1 [Diachasma alloeum]|uniref:phosphatidate cytidylyltransferase, mitochondrial isoform X1 n=1 Tax=Diachasma alloeum TaxID=454923 RepID=UPI0007384986|nr:phosphatidate cytidylyltransferase, mitochondrial isoform X1 [Diachasma alloeum]